MDVKKYLLDLKLYCEYNGVSFANMSNEEIKKHIRKMLKQIAHSSHYKIK